MKKKPATHKVLLLMTLLLFGISILGELNAWARAGKGGSSGSRGSRSFSSPTVPPSRPSPSQSPSPSGPGLSAPGRTTPSPTPMPPPASTGGGFFSRSPFWQGVAGGVAGGFLGSLLFSGRGYAGPGGGGVYGGGVHSGGGIGFLDILILGLLGYFLWRFFKKRRAMNAGTSYYGHGGSPQIDAPPYGGPAPQESLGLTEVDRGFAQISRYDPAFNEETFKETVQDLFFRIQAGWMNRSLEGIQQSLTSEMADYFAQEFQRMKQEGTINRLENIAVRRVEPSEVWQETGRDYVTVLFTANLLDYTVNERTGQVVAGDKLNPVKFQEFWTFCRDVGSSQWKLSGINQVEEATPRYN